MPKMAKKLADYGHFERLWRHSFLYGVNHPLFGGLAASAQPNGYQPSPPPGDVGGVKLTTTGWACGDKLELNPGRRGRR